MSKEIVCPHCSNIFPTDNHLTERELEVAGLAVRGMTVTNIGKKLFIAHNTARNHLTNIYAKLMLKDLIDLIKYFLIKEQLTIEEINMYKPERRTEWQE